MEKKKTAIEIFGEPINIYTSEQATEDGHLLELKILKDKIKGIDAPNSPFSYITVNLLKTHGYMTENYDEFCGHEATNELTGQRYKCKVKDCPHCHDKVGEIKFNYPNILDLLNQALQILKRNPRGDWFYSGKIELPSGSKQQIFIAQNETGKFTIMLPEDY